jgi:hypothetical protein
MKKSELQELIKECVREVLAERTRIISEADARLSNAIYDAVDELNPQNKPTIGFPTKKFVKIVSQHYGKRLKPDMLKKVVDELNMKSRWMNIRINNDITMVTAK